jgi:hypothetical protein
MGRQVTGAKNPTVLYVSGGNTQVTCATDFVTSRSVQPVVCVSLHSTISICDVCVTYY